MPKLKRSQPLKGIKEDKTNAGCWGDKKETKIKRKMLSRIIRYAYRWKI